MEHLHHVLEGLHKTKHNHAKPQPFRVYRIDFWQAVNTWHWNKTTHWPCIGACFSEQQAIWLDFLQELVRYSPGVDSFVEYGSKAIIHTNN